MYETAVTLIGWVETAPESHHLPDDTHVARFRMSVQERKWNRDLNDWGPGDRMFLTVKCWRKLADNVAACVAKNDPVVVTGRLYHREYDTEHGKRVSVEVEARAVGPDLGRCTVTATRNQLPLDGLPAREPAAAVAA